MTKFCIQGLGSTWWFFIYDPIDSALKTKTEYFFKKEIHKFNQQYSRFVESSYTNTLNQNGAIENFDAEFLEMIVFAQKLKQKSLGYFDISIGKTLEKIGYNKTFNQETPRIDESGQIVLPLHPINYSKLCDKVFIEISSARIQIHQDIIIDFGGFGKGWLADKLVKFIKSSKIKNFTVNAGGDIYSTSDTFYLEHPINLDESIGTINLKNEAIACSSSNRRKFKDNTHHLINPFTRQSQDDYLAVFTQAPTVLKADTASTILFVSPDILHPKLSQIMDVEYMVIYPDLSFTKSANYTGTLHS